MTDTNTNPVFYMPRDIWAVIANYLDTHEFLAFKQVCKYFNALDAENSILQPLYNRLRALDETLPALLPKENALDFFKSSFKKIQTRQQEEIAYLTQHHPDLMKEHENVVKANSSAKTLKSLEENNTILDAVNLCVIKKEILHKYQTWDNSLYLNEIHITRLVLKRDNFTEKNDITYFLNECFKIECTKNLLTNINKKDLTACSKLHTINCADNKIISLNLENYPEIKTLCCSNNQLTTLKLSKEIFALNCQNNQLATLDIPGKLYWLECSNNPLSGLDLTALSTLEEILDFIKKISDMPSKKPPTSAEVEETTTAYIEMETQLLFTLLALTTTPAQSKSAAIIRLGERYNRENCLTHGVEYHEPINSNSSTVVTAYASAFSANSSSSAANAQQKRALEENKPEANEKPEDQDKDKNGEPEAKRRKFD